ncbi:YegS/Rv2252/BmrU family lipid kinase [Prosthecochloris sp.]|uniref:diacylglycerol/lipid kinase family protein n=1 Tax=Prosthecochloris sp. TaxID=290513 RepID=UPI0025FE7D59|nr:YegS/Rv2252/BmrU family lipid kinase [Prosthecochloris sp.]
MTALKKKTTFIINPVANKGLAARNADLLRNAVRLRRDAVAYYSEYPGHAFELARRSLDQSRAVIACGGDGTAHEIANVLAFSDVCLGILPSGSANDFIKSLEHRFGLDYPIDAYMTANSVSADLGRVTGEGQFHRYFLNSLGMGLTGRIALRVKNTRWMKGDVIYLNALLSVLLGYKPPKMHIKLITPYTSIEMEESIFAFSVGNGRIEGGKFRIAPEAEINDGLLDVCILKAVPKAKFFSYALKYIRGTQIFDSRVIYAKVRAIEIEIFEPEVMHMDGEVFEDVQGKIRIDSVPSSIKVLC